MFVHLTLPGLHRCTLKVRIYFKKGVIFNYIQFLLPFPAVSGLQGPRGIIPLHVLPKQSLTLLLRPFNRPDVGMDVICIAGMVSSAIGILTARGRNFVNMSSLWWLYTSLKPDDPPMLQDAGFVALVTAASNHFGLALTRW